MIFSYRNGHTYCNFPCIYLLRDEPCDVTQVQQSACMGTRVPEQSWGTVGWVAALARHRLGQLWILVGDSL